MAGDKKSIKRPIETYEHADQERLNNPPAGLVTPATDPDAGQHQGYAYDPHLDPTLQWAGKAEHTSFEVPTVSLHVHERIDPRTIVEAVRKVNGAPTQTSFFGKMNQNLPLRKEIEFYQHAQGWSNRLVAGDSLLVMNSLIAKEGMSGKVQMVYIDPPYGIKYGSNFQPFVNKRDVKDGKDEDLTAEPEQITAFRDTWELGIHSYLTYLRDRLLLARELLTESGSIFVQISDENVHHVRELMDEVLGAENFISLVSFSTTSGFASLTLSRAGDYLVWYAKDKANIKYRQLYNEKEVGEEGATKYKPVGSHKSIPLNWWPEDKLVTVDSLTSQGPTGSETSFEVNGKDYHPPQGMHWKTRVEGLYRLLGARRVVIEGNSPRFLRFLDDFPVYPINNLWTDIGGVQNRTEGKIYVVQTSASAIQRCLLMTTDPGDLVLDPTCGSGTTAYVAEQWGRRWITCDTSHVALTLARQRLMTASYDYYELAQPSEGVGSGFKYKTVPHVTLKSIANNSEIREGMTRQQIDAVIARHADTETLYDQPLVDNKRTRVTGPFTVEAVPAPAVQSVEDILQPSTSGRGMGEGDYPADASIARSGETVRQTAWRDELQRTGIRGKAGQYIRFARLEALPGCRWLHADGETHPNNEGAISLRERSPEDTPQRIVVSFGPAHAPLPQNQVALALEESQRLMPRPALIVFCAFQFDPEAAKDIAETRWPGVTLLQAQMNDDLLTDDLKKKRSGNDTFWLIGQPDVAVELIREGDHQGKIQVSVQGFDYYNTRTGGIESGGADKIAVWLLDPDYDGRSLYPRQVFFPLADADEGWARLARNLKAEIDPDLIEAYRGTVSLPFAPGAHKRIAVKIVDDRGIESLVVREVD